MTADSQSTLDALREKMGPDWSVWHNKTGRKTTPRGWPTKGIAGSYVLRYLREQELPLSYPRVWDTGGQDPMASADAALTALEEVKEEARGRHDVGGAPYGQLPLGPSPAERQQEAQRLRAEAMQEAGVPQDASGRFAEPIATITLDDTTPDVLGVTQDPPHVELHVRDLRNGKNELRRYRIALEPL